MIERTYRVSDVVNEEFLRFPLTLLANPKYREMSLEAKFIYSLLLNRLTLSQKKQLDQRRQRGISYIHKRGCRQYAQHYISQSNLRF